MIGKIKGILSEIEGNVGLIETSGGIYYKVFLTPEIIKNNILASEIELYTYLHVKEDSLTLFGFEDKKKYQIFNMLLAVDGVGPKLAFVTISSANPTDIVTAVEASDYNFFSKVPGVGKKTAQKILIELSSKFDTEFKFEKIALSQDDITVVEALKTLGFDSKNLNSVIPKIDKHSSIESQIQQAIKLLTNHEKNR